MSYERTGLGIDPIVAQTASSSCPAGQTRAFSTQPCQPVCSTYQCPTGKNKIEFNRSYVGTAAQDSRTRQQALIARGCTAAPCSNGPQNIDGSAKTTYCCPPQQEVPATQPPPHTSFYSQEPCPAGFYKVQEGTRSEQCIPTRPASGVPDIPGTFTIPIAGTHYRFKTWWAWGVAGLAGVGLIWWLRKNKISKNPVPWHIESDRPDDIFGEVLVGEIPIGSVMKSSFTGPVWRASDIRNQIVKCDQSSAENAAAAVYAEWLKKGR